MVKSVVWSVEYAMLPKGASASSTNAKNTYRTEHVANIALKNGLSEPLCKHRERIELALATPHTPPVDSDECRRGGRKLKS